MICKHASANELRPARETERWRAQGRRSPSRPAIEGFLVLEGAAASSLRQLACNSPVAREVRNLVAAIAMAIAANTKTMTPIDS